MLNGSLESFALPDVLRFVASGKSTGRIEVTREEVAGELMIDRGRFVAARLADDDAPATADETLDVVVLLVDGSGGSFEFVDEDWAGGPLDLDADGLISAVAKRRDEWAIVVDALGSLDDPLGLTNHLPDGMSDVTLLREQWHMVSLVDGVRTVHDIARDTGESLFNTAAALADLASKGMVAPTGAAPIDGAPVDAQDEAAEMLRELGSDGEEDSRGASTGGKAIVRPLRTKTREEQRVRLRK